MTPIRAPTKKDILLPPVVANAGTQAAYAKKLSAMVDEMHKSVKYWLLAAYKKRYPQEIATDESASVFLTKVIRRLSRRWMSRFAESANELADYYAKDILDRSDAQMRSALKKAGFMIDFKLTDEMNNVLQANIAGQVGLIKSIPSQYFPQIEGAVMRSVAKGGDLKSLSEFLENRYGVTRRRAVFIAKDQVNKANATMNAERQKSLGIEEAQWVHTGGSNYPRHSHVQAGKDKLVYNIAKGAYIDGEYILPGELPNCRCKSRSIIKGID